MALAYRELEDFFAQLYEVEPSKIGTLKSRLKNFQRLGWPIGSNMGRGARVRYHLSQSLSLVLAMEMTRMGWPPERIVRHLSYVMPRLVGPFRETFFIIAEMFDHIKDNPELDSELYYVFESDNFSALKEAPQDIPVSMSWLVPGSKFEKLLDDTTAIGGSRSFHVINLSTIFIEFFHYVRSMKLYSVPLLHLEFNEWMTHEDVLLNDNPTIDTSYIPGVVEISPL